ncbi:metallophosphoesterase [Candidatus Parcubacteria bacterium]|nr:metallophosphoesterase [Candidatus Parcubacteria bacterium]
MQNFIFYSSYLAIPFFVFLVFFIFKKGKKSYKNKILFFITILLLLITSSFIYARFIERNIILTKTTKIETGFSAKLIVIADLHLGVYKDINFLKRVVKKINKIENADAVLIPGDFTYYPPENLEKLFSPLKDIKFPVYAILGNHDSEQPGPPIQEKLQKALENNGVIFLHNSSSAIKNKNIKILGLGDKWANQDEVSKINEFKKSDNLIVIAHNPDTSLKYENSIPDLTISGHTHGGQIRLPFLYKKVIPCDGDFDKGLYETKYGKIFVTAGLGEVGLPMRLGVPPTIEILELY